MEDFKNLTDDGKKTMVSQFDKLTEEQKNTLIETFKEIRFYATKPLIEYLMSYVDKLYIELKFNKKEYDNLINGLRTSMPPQTGYMTRKMLIPQQTDNNEVENLDVDFLLSVAIVDTQYVLDCQIPPEYFDDVSSDVKSLKISIVQCLEIFKRDNEKVYKNLCKAIGCNELSIKQDIKNLSLMVVYADENQISFDKCFSVRCFYRDCKTKTVYYK